MDAIIIIVILIIGSIIYYFIYSTHIDYVCCFSLERDANINDIVDDIAKDTNEDSAIALINKCCGWIYPSTPDYDTRYWMELRFDDANHSNDYLRQPMRC